MRVEQLSVRSGLSVDTIRYYQSKGLLDPPRREGRVAWYDGPHLDRLERIRTLQQRGFTLATIARLVSGDLDAADEALLGELLRDRDGDRADPGPTTVRPVPTARSRATPVTIDQLAAATGVPLALLKAVEAEDCSSPAGSAARSATRRGRGRGQSRPAASSSGASRSRPCSTWPAATTRPPRRWPTRRWPCSRPTCDDRSARRAGRPRHAAGTDGRPPTVPMSSGWCRPTPSSSRRSTPWSRSTSPAPWSRPPSTTSNRSAPTPNGRPSFSRSGCRSDRPVDSRSRVMTPSRPRPDQTELPHRRGQDAMVRSMFDTIAPRYDLVNRMMTFGLDIRWRRRSVRALGLPTRSRVLDLACGTGDFLPSSTPPGCVRWAWTCRGGCWPPATPGQPLAQADGAALPVATAAVDGVTCGYALRNFTELGAVFGELGRVVRPGGRISLLEVAEPEHALLRAGHRIWFRTVVPVIGGLFSDRPPTATCPGRPPTCRPRPNCARCCWLPGSRPSTTGPCREGSAS